MAEVNSALIGYAVLRANYNAQSPSYLDNFGAFVLAAMSARQPASSSRHQISTGIEESFGLRVPDLVVGRILRKLRNKGLTVQMSPETEQLTAEGAEQAPRVSEQALRFRRQLEELAADFAVFVTASLPEHVDVLDGSVLDALAGYFDKNAVPILNQSVRGRASRQKTSPGYDYLISRYVAHLASHDQARFGYVEDASKGAVLAAVLTLGTLGFSESLNGVRVVLDTPILLNVLGLHGDIVEAASKELLALASSQGAKLCAFEHSLRELDGILESAENSLRMPRSMSTSAVFLHLAETGKSASDVVILRRRVAEDLAALGVEVIEKPDNYARYGLDEVALEDKLQEKVHYLQSAARVHDVDSLSAIHRLRQGATTRHLEECRAVMITSNMALVRAANEFASERHPFPLSISEEALAGLLWVRSPAIAENVTRQQLIATAYAGMQPNGNLWSRYLVEVDELEKRQQIGADEAIVLRSTSTGRDAFMAETLGDPSEVTAEMPIAVLERLKGDLLEPLDAELKAAEGRGDAAAQEVVDLTARWTEESKSRKKSDRRLKEVRAALATIEANASTADARRRQRSRIHAAMAVRIPIGVLVMVFAGVAVLGVLGAISQFTPWAPLLFAVAGLGAALSAVRAFVPGTVVDWLRPVESKLAEARYKRLCDLAGVAPAPEQPDSSRLGRQTAKAERK